MTALTLHRSISPNRAYVLAHDRVRALRGKASDYRCVDCGEQAYDWSLKAETLADTEPGLSNDGRVCWWSPLPQDYEPRCKSDHKREDARRVREQREAEEWWRNPEHTGAEGWAW